jgi:hypothetical protein
MMQTTCNQSTRLRQNETRMSYNPYNPCILHAVHEATSVTRLFQTRNWTEEQRKF